MIMCPVADAADNQTMTPRNPAVPRPREPFRVCVAAWAGRGAATDPVEENLLFLHRLIYIKSYR